MRIIDGKVIGDSFGIFNKPKADKINAVEFNPFSSETLAIKRAGFLLGTKTPKIENVSGGKKVSFSGTTLFVMEIK